MRQWLTFCQIPAVLISSAARSTPELFVAGPQLIY